MSADADCKQCQHPFDPHAVIATTGDPAEGGIMLCPEPECLCFSTWGMAGGQTKWVPDAAEIDRLRRKVQADPRR